MATSSSWNIRGEVMEACSCDTTCPCNFGSNPTRSPCDAVLGWHIQEWTYGDTRLDNLNLVLFFRIPGYIFDGDWVGGVYLDERASPDQASALGTIFSGEAGSWPAVLIPLFDKLFDPKQVPIRIEGTNGNRRIEVPGLLEVGTEHVPNPMPEQLAERAYWLRPPLDLQVDALVVPFYTGPVGVRRARVLRLTDPNMSFEHSGRSSLVGQFEYSGP